MVRPEELVGQAKPVVREHQVPALVGQAKPAALALQEPAPVGQAKPAALALQEPAPAVSLVGLAQVVHPKRWVPWR